MKKLLYILLPVFALAIFNACEKQNADDLQGTWELASKPNENFDYKWTFKGSKIYVESTDNALPYDGSYDTCNVGNFILKNGVLTIANEGNFCNYSISAGDWDIQKLDEQFFTIRLDGESSVGTLWYEFVKIQ